MASLTKRRMPSAKPPVTPWSVKSCRMVFRSGGLGAFVGLGLESLRAFLAHGFVDQEADAFGQAARDALVSQELQNGVQEFRIGSVGRHGFALDVFGDTPSSEE